MPFGMIGDIVGSGISSASNIHMANKNTEFQRHMSNTAHQRQVADMRAAGLNPMLSATGGKGASSPTGTPGHMENPFAGMASKVKTTYEGQTARNASWLSKKTREMMDKKPDDPVEEKVAKDVFLGTAAGKNIGLGDTAASAVGVTLGAGNQLPKSNKREQVIDNARRTVEDIQHRSNSAYQKHVAPKSKEVVDYWKKYDYKRDAKTIKDYWSNKWKNRKTRGK